MTWIYAGNINLSRTCDVSHVCRMRAWRRPFKAQFFMRSFLFCVAARKLEQTNNVYIFYKKIRCVCVNIKCGDKDTFSDLCLSGVRASLADDLAIFVSKLASGSGVNDAF